MISVDFCDSEISRSQAWKERTDAHMSGGMNRQHENMVLPPETTGDSAFTGHFDLNK